MPWPKGKKLTQAMIRKRVAGSITWEGENSSDRGKIIVKDNVVKTSQGRVVYEDE